MDEMWPALGTPNNRPQPNAGTEGLAVQHRVTPNPTLEHSDREGGLDSGATAVEARESTPSSGSTHSKLSDTDQRDDIIRVLTLERDQLETSLGFSKRQAGIVRKENESLNRQLRDIRLQMYEGSSILKRQVATLTAEKRQLESDIIAAHNEGMREGMRTQSAQNERVILLQQIEGYKAEAAKWKQQAFGKGSEILNTRWQGSVDEAVRREREGDQLAMQKLQEEMAALKAEKRE